MSTTKELAQIVENMWCNGSVHEPTARAVKEALDRLAAYERPLEDAELAAIEESWMGASLFEGDFDGDDVIDAVSRAECSIPILLSGLRRERAEKEKRAAYIYELESERDALKVERNTALERLEALGKLGCCTYCGYVGPKETFAEHMAKCLTHPLSDAKDPDGVLASWVLLNAEKDAAFEAVWGLLCIAGNYAS